VIVCFMWWFSVVLGALGIFTAPGRGGILAHPARSVKIELR
jgi:hypothetical protein